MGFVGLIRPSTRVRRALLATTLLGAPLVCHPVFAQGGAPAADQQQEIVVTGSRLIRTDLTAPSPTQVVNSEQIRSAGNVTIERTLNQMPQLGKGLSSSNNRQGGAGVYAANLRGLGTSRTLTLVNGRRFIAANAAGDVDMSSVPDALVQRVDIISGGASAVYGSDAISGAVNFVLKDNFQGLEATANYGINERGDGTQKKFDVTFGMSSADNRGNVAMSFSYTKMGGFSQKDRPWSRVPLIENADNTKLVYGGSGNIPNTRIPVSGTQLARFKGLLPATTPGCTVTGVRFQNDGTPVSYCSPEDSWNYAPYADLQRPVQRLSATAIGHYDLTDHITAFMETYFVNVKNVSSIAPESFVPTSPTPTDQGLPPFRVRYVNNPALPAVTAKFFADNAFFFDPNNTGYASISNGGARTLDFGNRISDYERYGFDGTGGLRGDVDLAGRNFKWEVFGQYMRSHQIQKNIGFMNYTRLTDAANNCPSGNPTCVPINIFGSLNPAAKSYVTPMRTSFNTFNRWVAGASISGSPFDLPAGPVATAVGVEYRRDFYHSTPDPFSAAGENGGVPDSPIAGGFTVKEVFGEIGIPLLADLPFVHRLELNGAVRYSDYSSIGGVVAYKGGAEYAPVSWFRFRGAYNRAIRAPNVGEIFVNPGIGYNNATDPCDISRRPSAAAQAFCVRQGVPQADIATFRQSALGLNSLTLPSSTLKAEKSDTYTVGAVISPPFVRNLNLTVDYYNVRVNGAISRPSLTSILTDCFAALDLANQSCQAIVRDNTGQILYVKTNTQNIGYVKTSGIDAQIDYRLMLPGALSIGDDPAQLSLSAVVGYMFDNTSKVLTQSTPIDCAGYYGSTCSTGTGGIQPNLRINLNSTYTSGPVSWRLSGRMIGALDVYPGVKTVVQHVAPVWYVDSSISFDILKNFRFTVGINNLFDKQPPVLGTTVSGDANVDVTLYDIQGRRYFTSVTLKF